MKDIIERLEQINRNITCGAKSHEIQKALDALQLDIEIYCRRSEVAIG